VIGARWRCDDPDCLRTDSASTWDEVMEGATGRVVYRHSTALARMSRLSRALSQPQRVRWIA